MPFTKHLWKFRTKSFQGRSKQGTEDVPIPVSEEFHFDGGVEHPLFQTSGNESAVPDSLAVLFRGHNHRGRIVVGCIPDGMEVGTGELMMVGEVEMLDYLVVAAKIIPQRRVVGYA